MRKILFTVMSTIALFLGLYFTPSASASATGISLEALPKNCVSATDNCNHCGKMGTGTDWACTLMACPAQTGEVVYTCTAYTDDATLLPDTCIQGNDGCNSCFRATITDPRGCTKMYCETPGPASCTEYAKGPFAIVKEGELTNGSVSPDYAKICLPGLSTINPYEPNLVGGGVLCYDPVKGVPTCQLATGEKVEGRYYPNGTLLRQMNCPGHDPIMCTMQYEPVCASVAVQCIKAPCPPVLETFGNKCMMSASPYATYLHDGVCTDTDIPGLKPGEGYAYHNITSFLDNAYKVWGFGTEQMIAYTQTIIDKIDNLFMTARLRQYTMHKYQQIERFLEIYMSVLGR